MEFDQNNPVVKLCAFGIELEGKGALQDAADIFYDAWTVAESDFEKFTAAHYVARRQDTVQQKLEWDLVALNHALLVNDQTSRAALPSLYLNIAKCYEDLGDFTNATTNYELAESFVHHIPDEGYGTMIRTGIRQGLERIGSLRKN